MSNLQRCKSGECSILILNCKGNSSNAGEIDLHGRRLLAITEIGKLWQEEPNTTLKNWR